MHQNRVRVHQFFAAFCLLLFAAGGYAQPGTGEPSTADIAKLFTRWNETLQTGKADEVVNLYAPNAVLLPTVSNKVRHSHAEIKDYFEHFLAYKPTGKINQQNIRVYGPVAIDSGIYTFTLTKDGKQSEVRARYTFVYHRQGDRWLIVEHHSSAMPEGNKGADGKK